MYSHVKYSAESFADNLHTAGMTEQEKNFICSTAQTVGKRILNSVILSLSPFVNKKFCIVLF